MNDQALSVREAYLAMYTYLESLYEQTGSDPLGGLLGGMSFIADGETADPAAWADWLRAVDKVRRGAVDSELGLPPRG